MTKNDPQNQSHIPSPLLATKALRICCYGSSSPKTQERYKNDAYKLGYVLTKKGHTCVNGAGAFGCMGSLNKGCEDANGPGYVVGVIHKMFVEKNQRDGSWLEGCAPVFSNSERAEIYVAGGDDLQERKRMLVKDADALIVMPGGPGTFDELWEMACSRQIGLIDIPIVCVNIDGYYDSFQAMLQRAHDDHFLYKQPKDILHFEPNSERAIEWIETYVAKHEKNNGLTKKQRHTLVRKQSLLKRMMSAFNLPSTITSIDNNSDDETLRWKNNSLQHYVAFFSAGLVLGFISSRKR